MVTKIQDLKGKKPVIKKQPPMIKKAY